MHEKPGEVGRQLVRAARHLVVPPAGREQYRQFVWFFPYVNERIRALPARHADVVLADWTAVSNEPGLTYDAFHLTARGVDLMASVLEPAIGRTV